MCLITFQETLPHSRLVEKIGWINGLKWESNYLYQYPTYGEVWHLDEGSLVDDILVQLQKTKQFTQHKCVDVMSFILQVLRVTCYVVIAVNIIQTILDVIELQVININAIIDTYLNYKQFSLTAAILIPVNFYLKSFFRCKLEYSLKKYLKQINQLTIMKDHSLFLKFSDYDCVVCCCWKCCYCFRLFFYDPTDYETVEIWSYKNVMENKEQVSMISQSSLLPIMRMNEFI